MGHLKPGTRSTGADIETKVPAPNVYGPLCAGDDVIDQYSSGVELLAAGRMAEVFVIDDERVVKLDRREWNGVSALESDVITRVAESGLPVVRSHGVITIDERCGVVLDRLYGPSLLQVVIESAPVDIDSLAEQFAALHSIINAAVIEGLPDLVGRLRGEIERSSLPSQLLGELSALLTQLDDGTRRVCHYDLHPDNVIVTAAGWIVIDWLGVASGPPLADLARTLLLGAQNADSGLSEFTERFDGTVCGNSAWSRPIAMRGFAWPRQLAYPKDSRGSPQRGCEPLPKVLLDFSERSHAAGSTEPFSVEPVRVEYVEHQQHPQSGGVFKSKGGIAVPGGIVTIEPHRGKNPQASRATELLQVANPIGAIDVKRDVVIWDTAHERELYRDGPYDAITVDRPLDRVVAEVKQDGVEAFLSRLGGGTVPPGTISVTG